MKPINKAAVKGYNYRLKLSDGNKKVTTITVFGKILKIDEKYYKTDKEIKTDIFNKLFN